jgi:hypothetical protein
MVKAVGPKEQDDKVRTLESTVKQINRDDRGEHIGGCVTTRVPIEQSPYNVYGEER